jgi:hypothetical protein
MPDTLNRKLLAEEHFQHGNGLIVFGVLVSTTTPD